ncbi:hypothetical protein C8J57DRAFT_1733088 [Mycena rebaudengoi]|nr:hypothetical protein C8J57DRAFT_1733088 [Mycena rebaudengoi]
MALPKSPNLSIEFVIVGASVAGLGAAYKLREVGHEVTLLDKENGSAKLGGLRVPPNMARLIYTMPGGATLLQECGTKCSGITFMQGDTGEILGRMKFFDEIMDDLGAAFYMLPYDALIRFLLEACRKSGVKIVFSAKVTSVELAVKNRPVVIMESGERIEADVLIGADGHNSRLRDALVALPTPPTAHADDSDDGGYTFSLPSNVHKITGGTCIIPLEALKIDSDLVAFTDLTDFQIWTGHNLLASGHRCGTDLYILSIVRTQATPETTVDEDSDWALTDLTIDEEYRAIINAQDSMVSRLLEHATTCHRTVQYIPEMLRLADSSTRIVIIGDAAHAIPVHCSHNSSISLEDGFTLGFLFSHLTSRTHIPVLIEAYNEIRYARTVATERSEIAGVVASSLGPGPARERRNQQFRDMARADSMENADSMIAAVWEDYLKQFVYDAKEAVDEWKLLGSINLEQADFEAPLLGSS